MPTLFLCRELAGGAISSMLLQVQGLHDVFLQRKQHFFK